jgi:hypothetical protein
MCSFNTLPENSIIVGGTANFGAGHQGTILRESLSLSLARSLHTLANGGRGFTYPVIAELFVIHPGNVDVDINSIKQGTRDSLLIFRDNSGRTWTGLDGIPTITTGAGIHTLGHMIRVLSKVIKWV